MSGQQKKDIPSNEGHIRHSGQGQIERNSPLIYPPRAPYIDPRSHAGYLSPSQQDWPDEHYNSIQPGGHYSPYPRAQAPPGYQYVDIGYTDPRFANNTTAPYHFNSNNNSPYVNQHGNQFGLSPPHTPNTMKIGRRSASKSFQPGTPEKKARAFGTEIKAKKAAKKEKAADTSIPKMDAPISELLKDCEVPVKDMEEWVNRSEEDRRAQRDIKGKTQRPMNSFMLYRSAYADQVKKWLGRSNHQDVSKALGQSWPNESKEIRDAYTLWAKIERENHAKAFPEYKFSPNKPASAPKKRKDRAGTVDEDDDLEDQDSEWQPNSRAGSTKRIARQSAHLLNSSAQGLGLNFEEDASLYHATYELNNPSKAPPMRTQDVYGNWYETTINPNSRDMSNPQYRSRPLPNPIGYHPMGGNNSQSVVGMPGSHHHGLFDTVSDSMGPKLPFNEYSFAELAKVEGDYYHQQQQYSFETNEGQQQFGSFKSQYSDQTDDPDDDQGLWTWRDR